LSVLDITGFFFHIRTQVTALVLRTSAFTWVTRDGLPQPFGDFICTGSECHICSKRICISTATFSITTATLSKPYCHFWRYQTTKHRANRNTLPDNQTQSQQKYVTKQPNTEPTEIRYQTTKHRANRNSGEVRLKLWYMIFHYSYISVKNKSNNRTQIPATEYRRNKIKRLLKKKRHNSKTRQNRDNTHENDKKDGYTKTTEHREKNAHE
jgi:hypothetical protein